MLSAGRPSTHGSGSAQGHPKRPAILLAAGLTGQGVPELLAELDQRGAGLAADPAQAQRVRLARAEAQVTGILVDRTREALRAPSHRAATEETLRAVAAHELDPYAAADTLLAAGRETPD